MKQIDSVEKITNFLIVLMIFSGSSILATYRIPLIIIITIMLLLECIIRKKIAFPIKSFNFKIYVIVLLYGLISFIYSYNFLGTLKLVIIYALALFLWNSNFTDKRINNLKKLFLIASVILALSIIVSVFIDNFIFNYFSFWIPKESGQLIMMKNELRSGIYSGLACERAEAAYLLNIGCIIIISKVIKNKKIKIKDAIEIILLILSIMLTGKRSLIIIPILVSLVLLYYSGIKNKFGKTFIIMIVILMGMFIAINLFPAIQVVIDRFTGSDSMDSVYDRINNYWKYAFEMFERRPIMGYGLGSFKYYISKYRSYELYNAHNIYIQLLGESGLIGILLYGIFFIYSLRKNIYLIKKYKNNMEIDILFFILGMQILFLVYGLTGNNLYTYNQLYLEILCIASLEFFYYKKEV